MNFNSLEYYAFFPLAALAFFALPRSAKNPFLLLASYFFYMRWEPVYALLMLSSTAVTYACSLLVDRAAMGRRKTWLAACLATNLLMLFFFKYFNFAAALAARGLSLASGAEVAPLVSRLLLPVGISFYTFQALGYTIDVYRRTLPAEKNFIDYALFVSFFPQLVAGPIERSANLLPQLKEHRRFTAQGLFSGAALFFWGLFKKLVIADRLSILVNTAFGSAPGSLGGFSYAVAAAAFTVQIYCDFSAYSDIARGSARVMGISLMRNFDAPLLASSIKDFWRRWHISLSTWFKDYLYFPLGGSRSKAALRRYANLMAVFVVSGLWHGAALTFFFWGLLHGAFSVSSVATRRLRERALAALRMPERNRAIAASLTALRVAFNFCLVAFAFVFFRAESLSGGMSIVGAILRDPLSGSPLELGLSKSQLAVVAAAVALLFAVDVAARRVAARGRGVMAKPAGGFEAGGPGGPGANGFGQGGFEAGGPGAGEFGQGGFEAGGFVARNLAGGRIAGSSAAVGGEQLPGGRSQDLADIVSRHPATRYAAYFFLVAATLIFGCYGDGFNPQEFIYFQF